MKPNLLYDVAPPEKPTELCGCFGRSPPARQPREWPAPIYSNQRYRRRRRRQYRNCSDVRRLSFIGLRLDWCFKEIEKHPAGISDLPSRIVPSNKRLTENIEVWCARGQPFHPVGPVRATSDQNCHCALEIGQRSAALRMPANTFNIVI